MIDYKVIRNVLFRDAEELERWNFEPWSQASNFQAVSVELVHLPLVFVVFQAVSEAKATQNPFS